MFERVAALLASHDVAFEVFEHDAVFTSEEAARVRGTSLSSGAKALICKADERFVMFVMPADRQLASKMARKALGVRRLRFASRDELFDRTGLTPGAVPPFGSLFGLQTFCDAGLADEQLINFNAGDHSRSISLNYTDYQRVEQPVVGSFAE